MRVFALTTLAAALLALGTAAVAQEPMTTGDETAPPMQQQQEQPPALPPLGTFLFPLDQYAPKADMIHVNVSGGGTPGVVVSVVVKGARKTVSKGSATTNEDNPVVYIPLKLSSAAKKAFKKKKLIPLSLTITITPPGQAAIVKTAKVKLHRGTAPNGCYRGSAAVHVAC
jgi:hypothetical protein